MAVLLQWKALPTEALPSSHVHIPTHSHASHSAGHRVSKFALIAESRVSFCMYMGVVINMCVIFGRILLLLFLHLFSSAQRRQVLSCFQRFLFFNFFFFYALSLVFPAVLLFKLQAEAEAFFIGWLEHFHRWLCVKRTNNITKCSASST